MEIRIKLASPSSDAIPEFQALVNTPIDFARHAGQYAGRGVLFNNLSECIRRCISLAEYLYVCQCPASLSLYCLSYVDPGSCAKKEPARATRFMARAGGGWIVTGLVVMDRFRV